ncbi:MAG: glycosyl hydrolase [Planctomycetota bacterium]
MRLIAVCMMLALVSTALSANDAAAQAPAEASIAVSGEQWGVSTRYIGANEGGGSFDIDHFTDCGLNTFRIYLTLLRMEPVDDDGVYGSPSPEQIKADPDIIPWEKWDEVMDGPFQPWTELQVTWRQVLGDLQGAGVKTVLSLRNFHDRETWIAEVPRTEEDWNEWWQFCFAVAYWLNVRNDYGIDDYEVFNEPDVPDQGWRGTREEYCEMVRRTSDAIASVYRTYLPGRTYHVHAPVTAGPGWVAPVLAEVGEHFDSLNVHTYAWDLQQFIRRMHRMLEDAGRPDYPLWISEWGTYSESYDGLDVSLSIVANLLRGSQPDHDYLYGSHIFSLYEWGESMDGLVREDGRPALAYYAMRLATRALQGAKPTFRTSASVEDLLAITTRDPDGKVNLILVNQSRNAAYRVTADLSELMGSGTGTLWQFSADVRDEVVGQVALAEGLSTFDVPAAAAVLVRYSGGEE